jgi:hypothetical protein
MPDWATIIAQLNEHATKNALLDRARQGFEIWFVNKGDRICGWIADEVVMEFCFNKLAFSHGALPPYVETCFALHTRDGQRIGTYRLITDLEGATTDDYLVFDVTRGVQG